MASKIDQLEKIRNIQAVICCPYCQGEIDYAQASRCGDVIIAGKMHCRKCGEIGTVINGKFVFNDNFTLLYGKPCDLTGSLTQRIKGFNDASCSPSAVWRPIEEFVYAEAANSRITIKTSAIGIDLHLLKHNWSGIIELRIDGRELCKILLYQDNGSILTSFPIFLGVGQHVVEVAVVDEIPVGSKSSQCIFKGFSELTFEKGDECAYLAESGNLGNPYTAGWDDMVAAAPKNGLILDCGSGDRSYPDNRVVNFEYCAFGLPDVFGDGHHLPFKDDAFDLILSQAVVEHLYDPLQAGREIFRVAKQGAKVLVESAFMQPQHAVPYHYFNTTRWGLLEVFKQFSDPLLTSEGTLGDTVNWIYRLTELRAKGFGDQIDTIERQIRELDKHITPDELAYFSSFVTLTATKS